MELQRQRRVFIEEACQPPGAELRRGVVARAQITLDPAAPAAAQTDQPLPVRGQLVPAEAARGQRLALRAALDQRGEPAQRAIAGGAGRQQDELAGYRRLLFPGGEMGGQVRLTASVMPITGCSSAARQARAKATAP